MDMAGFAIKLEAFVESGARFDLSVENGQLETSILEQVMHEGSNKGKVITEQVQSKVAMLADCCSKILVRHTRTAQPWKWFEGRYARKHPTLEA